ncbi:MAG: hypothetical protein K6G58_01270 [Lachnospiraceae bacterium]|nr:hypothetical protein [Lachnospiraceae bacterium]
MIIDSIASVLCRIKSHFSCSGHDDRGIGVVEVILILVVLIGLVVIFRDQLTALVNNIFGNITNDVNAL